MKLDTKYLQYLTSDDWKVLSAVEAGSRNHEVVPTKLISQLAARNGVSSATRPISDLAKINLISKQRNAKYDGYKLTYNGADYLILRALKLRGSIETLEPAIGVGKESDIYGATTTDGEQRVLKIHRLGRISFKAVKSKRDYLRNRQAQSWAYLSGLAAVKEYNFMTILHSNGFSVPIPYDQTRQGVLMEQIVGFTMRALREHSNYKLLYSELMQFIVDLAEQGLIHGDFNEYNIMMRDDGTWDRAKGEKGFVVIDFPQIVSIEHPDAEFYFNRDVECVRRFFKRRFKYVAVGGGEDTDGWGDGYKYAYPKLKDIERKGDLDVQVKASGYGKKLNQADRDLAGVMSSTVRESEIEDEDEDEDEREDEQEGEDEDNNSEDEITDFEEYQDSEDGSGDEAISAAAPVESLEEENERIIEALSTGVGNLKMDKLGNYILED